MPAAISNGLPGIWGLALLATRWFVPAESAHLGETLWIVQLWLLTACVWSLFVVLQRSRPPRLDRADAAVWLLVAPWALAGFGPGAFWNNLAVGVALLLLSLRRGQVNDRFGTWDRCVV